MRRRLSGVPLLVILVLSFVAGSALAQQNPNQFKGFDADKMYSFQNIDNINTFNGNLLITLPLGPTFSVNASLSYGAPLVYNANVWDFAMTTRSATAFPSPSFNAGLGWSVSYGRLVPPGDPENPTGRYGSTYGNAYVYIAQDGSQHIFPPDPDGSGLPPSSLAYDESFLRMVPVDSTHRRIEFPDGRVQEFTNITPAHTRWRLTRIYDRFNNEVSFSYDLDAPGYYEVWNLLDSHGRRLQYYFFRDDAAEYKQIRLDKVVMPAFDNSGGNSATATYQLRYAPVMTSRPPSDNSICSSISIIDDEGVEHVVTNCVYNDKLTKIWFLTGVELPNGETISMTLPTGEPAYAVGRGYDNGHIKSLTFPTGGRLEWDFTMYNFPAGSTPRPPKVQSIEPGVNNPFIISTGVSKRRLYDRDGSMQEWKYQHRTGGKESCIRQISDTKSQDVGQWHQLVTAVTAPNGTTTYSYFSIYSADDFGCPNNEGWNELEYGLPFTRYKSDGDGRFLSTQVMSGGDPTITHGGTPTAPEVPETEPRVLHQTTYVAYDLVGDTRPRNGKLVTASKTIFNHDTSCGGQECFVESRSKDYAEYGRFREQSSGGNLGGGYTTSFTDYADLLADSLKTPVWFTALHTVECRADALTRLHAAKDTPKISGCDDLGTGRRVVNVCFDAATGYLKGKRILAGLTEGDSDVTVLYRDLQHHGNIDAEEYYGGDVRADGYRANPDLCSVAAATPQYRILREYAGGMVASQHYDGVAAYIERNDIDVPSGLIRSSRSAATADDNGIVTDYKYDSVGRVTDINPRGSGAWTHYQYNLATASSPASVDVYERANGGGALLREKHFFFDGLGRLTKEQRSAPGSPSMVMRLHTYDAAGRKISVSDWGAENTTLLAATRGNFDAFDRPQALTATDGSVTTVDYNKGKHKTTTTQKVATPAGVQNATRVEETDERGRVLSVSEPSGSEGAVTKTVYAYDVDDHLTSVTTVDYDQARSFTYDHRGFMTQEKHPESGATDYSLFDARGHAQKSVNGAFTLTYSFDAAERPLTVTQVGAGVLKELYYDRPNAAPDYSMGKVDRAVRHNYNSIFAGGDLAVTERYTYGGTFGTASKKVTTTSSGQTFEQEVKTDDLGLAKTIIYPTCSAGCGSVTGPARTVTNQYEAGMLVGVEGFTAPNGIGYHANGALKSVIHAGTVAVTDNYGLYKGTTRVGSIDVISAGCNALTIDQAPRDTRVGDDGKATFTITVTTPGATVEWYEGESGDAAKLAGTGTTFVTPVLTKSTMYWARVKSADGGCAVDTATVIAEVCEPVLILEQPVGMSQQITTGSVTLSASVTVRGMAPFSFKWYSSANALLSSATSGTPTSTYSFTTSVEASQSVYAVITDACGKTATSQTVTLAAAKRTCVPFDIKSYYPVAAVLARAGQTITIAVSLEPQTPADTTDSYSYSWYHGDGTFFASGISAVNVTTSSYDSYYVVVANSCGLSRRSPTTYIRVTGTCPLPPVTITPSSVTVPANGTATLTAITNWPDLGYQWYRGESGNTHVALDSVAGHADTLVVPDVAATYWVRISNSCGETADSAAVTVNRKDSSGATCTPVTIRGLSADSWIASASPIRIAVDAGSSVPPLHYAWYIGEGQTAGIVNNDAPAATVNPTGTTKYWVKVTNGCGASVDSRYITVHVNACGSNRFVTDLPAVQQVDARTPFALTVSTSVANTSFAWYEGESGDTSRGAIVSGATFASSGLDASKSYWVRATSADGCSFDSHTAFVDVCVHAAITQTTTQSVSIVPGEYKWIGFAYSGTDLHYQWYVGAAGDTSQPWGDSTDAIQVHPLQTTKYWVRVSNRCSTTPSDELLVAVCQPLVVSWAPGAVTNVRSAQSQVIQVRVPTGARATFYDGVPGNVAGSHYITGPDANYGIGIAPTTTTTYWARIVDADGICSTDTGGLTVNVCVPQIGTQPQSQLIQAGASAVLTVAADLSPVTYQWFANGTAIAGATSASYTASPAADTTYTVRVTGSCTSYVDSNPAVVSICRPAVIAQQPQSVIATPPVGGDIGVGASGTDLKYQWYQGASGVTTTPVGTNSASIHVAPPTSTQYWVRVTATGCATPADSAAAWASVCARITQQPAAAQASVMPGNTTTITLAASGSPLTYQWYQGVKGDTSKPVGTNAATLTTPALSANTTFWCAVTSGSCVTQSEQVTVNVCALTVNWSGTPALQVRSGQSQTLSISTAAGLTATLYTGTPGNVAASTVAGGPGAAYSWTIAPTTTRTYWVRVADAGGCYADTAGLTVTVCKPQIATQPVGASINQGQSVTLTVAADIAPVTYQWYTNGAAISGATAASYVATPASTSNYQVRITGSCTAYVDSNVITVNVCVPPTITQQPASVVSQVNGADLAVTASGTSNTYQWYLGASGTTTSPIAGATAPTIHVAPASTQNYWVRVTGCGTSRDSATATVTVCTNLITAQPQNASIVSGQTATLTVGASGSPLSYQWYRGAQGDMTQPVGTNSASFTTPALTATTSYWVLVSSGPCSTQSAAATVSVCTPPAVTWTAIRQSVASHENQLISVNVGTSSQTASQLYWYSSETGPSGPWNLITGPVQATTISVAPTVKTYYWTRAINGCAGDSPVVVINICVPTITTQPTSTTIVQTQTTRLYSAADMAASIQWYTGASGNTSSPIAGATNTYLDVTPSSTTSYWARYTGNCGIATNTNAATVNVCVPAVVNAHPASTSPVSAGTAVSLSVQASGTNLLYQWYVGDAGYTGNPIAGATAPSVTVTANYSEKYWCQVRNECSTVNSNAAWVSVNPVITQQPQSRIINPGTSARLSITANGTYLQYAWYQSNGTLVQSGGSNVYDTPALTQQTSYYCVVYSAYGSVSSMTATVSLCQPPYITAPYVYWSGTAAYVGVDQVVNATYDWYQGHRGDMSTRVSTGYYNEIRGYRGYTYWVRVTGANGCYVDSQEVTVY